MDVDGATELVKAGVELLTSEDDTLVLGATLDDTEDVAGATEVVIGAVTELELGVTYELVDGSTYTLLEVLIGEIDVVGITGVLLKKVEVPIEVVITI